MEYENLTKQALIAILKRRDAQARYGLHWERSDIEADKALNRDFVGLEFDASLSCGAGPHRNFIIEGDNYDALRHLATTHAGAFHLIYIDVPYNTGRRDFVYNDHYFDTTNRYRHSTWLEFMYQRLVLAKSLLREGGAIFISIDDNELFNLGLLMNQVFGERRFVANCIWQKRYSRENREAIGDAHEYLLVYAPNPDKFKQRRGRIPLTEVQAKVYKNPENPSETDPTKRWRGIPMTAQGFRPNQMYAITSPTGKVHTPPEGRCWSMVEPEFLKLQEQGRVYWGKDGNAQPSIIRYLSEVEGAVPWTWWPHEEVGHTDEARKEIQAIFGTQTAFDTPKPVRLMERVLQIGAPEKDALILDFFAGSGTTAQAVLKMNKEDGGARRFVLVSSREATDEDPDKNLCRDVCAKRVRDVIEGYRSTRTGEVPGLGGEFAYLRAKPVAMHRLEEHLTDEMVWNFALMACDHPVTALELPLAISVNGSHLVAYCANTRHSTLDRLAVQLDAFEGKVVVLTWAPQAVTSALGDLADQISIVSIPGDLRRIFKQGNARVTEFSEELEVPE
ncbi:site-specific DNA-methyltransferase [Burkholderia sp. BCC1993]|uniref:site-specific DNA-methyltransferase n=1 Tax=Burkholderia sp. BCC1993 TaxID=2817444 RepID=UPI002AB1A27A|nr:site-specific DNA-methyltransferase [Burkholderia sp. BCC1993]